MNKGLTTFRGLTLISIFLFHCYVFEAGDLAVQGFFVLSGFLLTKILVKMKKNTFGAGYFLNFWGRRALRIFPLYYGYLLVVIFLTLPFFLPDGKSGIPRIDRFYAQLPWVLTYTFNFFHASADYKHTHFIVHFWSLAVEEQFYLLWPIAIYFIQSKHLRNFLLGVIILSPLVRYFLGEIVKAGVIPGLGSQVDLVVYVLPFSHFDAFAVGGLFSLYGRAGSSRSIWCFLCLIIALGCFTSWVAVSETHWAAFGYSGFMKNAYQYVWGYSLLNIFFAYLLVTLRDGTFLPRVFENKYLHYVGEISYGMYVFHYPIIWFTGEFFDSVNGVGKILISFSATFILGSLSYEFMEKRFISLKEKYFVR